MQRLSSVPVKHVPKKQSTKSGWLQPGSCWQSAVDVQVPGDGGGEGGSKGGDGYGDGGDGGGRGGGCGARPGGNGGNGGGGGGDGQTAAGSLLHDE